MGVDGGCWGLRGREGVCGFLFGEEGALGGFFFFFFCGFVGGIGGKEGLGVEESILDCGDWWEGLCC